MPNGADKNWIRLCAAVDGFYVRYAKWPTRVRLFPLSLEDLRAHVLSSDAFATVTSKVQLVPDEAPMIAEDEEGRSYDYGRDGFPPRRPSPTAEEWFGVHPRPELGY